MEKPLCHRCHGHGKVKAYWLYPDGKPEVIPCPVCYPEPLEIPALEPEPDNDGPLLAIFHGPGQWEFKGRSGK